MVVRLVVIILLILPSDTHVYYVTPTNSLRSECPGQPCETLDHYFKKGDRYFSRSKVNVMMKFLLGIHNLSSNSFHFEDLNRFEMIGLKPADDVIVHVSATVNFTNTAAVLIESLTIKKPNHMPDSGFIWYQF